MWLQVAYITAAAALVALNAFFVLAEFAIVKVRATRMRELADGGNKNAAQVLAIIGRMDAYLSTCQLGITVASLGLGWVGEPAFARLLEPLLLKTGAWSSAVSHSIAVAIAFVFITLVHVVIGELAPKSISIRKSERAALIAARPLRFFHLVTFPAMWLLNATSNLVLRLIGLTPGTDLELAHSESELKMILGTSHEHGMFTLSRLLMMENVIDFGTLKVADVMIPADKVTFLDPARPWEENVALIEKTLYSRYPIAGNPVRREVHIKDIALALARNARVDLATLGRPAPRVPSTMPLEELLRKYHASNPHLAIVMEGETMVGIVTFEDVIEELVGTIRDEFQQVRDYRLSELVPRTGVLLDLKGGTKEEVIRQLALGIGETRSDVDVTKAMTAVMKRENLASTGLGDGIAIPHGRVDGLPRAAAAIGRAKDAVPFESIDGKPVNLVFLILSPTHDEGAHLHILEKISHLLASDYLRERLMTAETQDEVMEVFRHSDRSIPA